MAVVSAVVAVVSLLFSWWIWRESRRVDLSVGAAQSYDGARLFTKDTVLAVTILNPSVSTANLTGAEIRFGGQRLADVNYVVPDVNALSPVARRDVISASLHLPVSIPPGRDVIAGLVTSDPDIGVAERLAKAANPAYGTRLGAPAAPFSWCHTVTYRNGKRVGPGLAHPGRLGRAGQLQVVMQFNPGGRRTATIWVTPSLAGTYEPGEEPDVLPGWHVELDVVAERVKGLVLFKPMYDPPENARIKLWRGKRRRPVQTRIDLMADQTACIDFGALHADVYRWSAGVGGGTVAAGRFRTPCTLVSDRPRQRQSVDPVICDPDRN